MSFLDELNPPQRRAAEHFDGPLLILAGAGAGKTKTITHRIANLIAHGVAPENILAVTFTNKAAGEMRDRVEHLLQATARPTDEGIRPTIRTFHSLGVLILRENFAAAGLKARFSILDRGDSRQIIRNALKDEGYDPKTYDPVKILSIISRQKGDLISPDEYLERERNNYLAEVVASTWQRYEKRLRENQSLDFDDLLSRSTLLLEKNPDILKTYQDRWKYIHVDEYQDTNEVQYRMTRTLASAHKNICVVGDVDQNIYSWRGATIKNIMNFEQDYPEATEIILEQNYRSTQNILQAANEVIAKNVKRREKNLFTKNPDGEKITIYQAIDEYDEANFAVEKAQHLIANGTSPNEIAFLYRANFQSRVLEEVCLRRKLPHQVIGTRFFDRREIKDVIAYIKAALNPADFTSLNRIINTPPRGIGKATILKIRNGSESTLTPAIQRRISEFRNMLKRIQQAISSEPPHSVITKVFKESGLEERHKKEGEEGAERIENVRELVSLAKKYEGRAKSEGGTVAMDYFLEDISLSTDQDELDRKSATRKNSDGVKLMTVHAAKGLEFDYVFVTGLEDGLFPHERIGEGQKNNVDEEEERRLFYVAITRARRKLYLIWASFRTIYGSKQVSMSSEFLDDISDNLKETENYAGNFGDGTNENNSSGNITEYLIDY